MIVAFFIKYGVKYVLPILGVLALLFGVYEYGHSRGYNSGYASGHQVAWDTQQKTINAMVEQQNAQNKANNDKIASLESDSQTYANQIADLTNQLKQKRAQVVTKYVQANPQSSQTCGFDDTLSSAINQILQPSN